MAHPDHNAVIDAFRRVAGTIHTCNRGDPNDGYTHIHGPNFPPAPGATRCTNHAVVVEKQNGTVSPREAVAALMGGQVRPQCPISAHPLGYSHRENFGSFPLGFEFATICANWPSLDDFAREVIVRSQAASRW